MFSKFSLILIDSKTYIFGIHGGRAKLYILPPGKCKGGKCPPPVITPLFEQISNVIISSLLPRHLSKVSSSSEDMNESETDSTNVSVFV